LANVVVSVVVFSFVDVKPAISYVDISGVVGIGVSVELDGVGGVFPKDPISAISWISEPGGVSYDVFW